jgi:chromosome segregation ATPase
MSKGHSSINLAIAKGIPVRVAAPEQPLVPKTKIWIDAKTIGLKVYEELADFLMEQERQKKKPSFLRKKENKVNLEEILADIDARVTEAFEKELAEVSTNIPEAELEEALAGFKREARLEFLREVARYWPELREQVYTLAPELAPPPELGREQLSRLRELQKTVDKAIKDMEHALQTITQALDMVAEAAREEHSTLQGTAEAGKGRLQELPSQLAWAIRMRITQWLSQQAGFTERVKPLTEAVKWRRW